MKSVGLVVISVLALLVACGGGSGPAPIPPPDEIGPRVATVNHAVWENDAALKDPVEDHLDKLESTIATIVEAHGEQSVEAVQALQETSSLLASARRWDLALPFMERALALSREVYGVDHRETAFALNDVAVLLTKIAPDGYDPRAELLFQGAVDVRRRRAGIDQPETAVSEADLAWQLMLGAGRESLPHRKYPLLVQAEHLALHAQRVLDEHEDSTNRMLIRRTLVETAFARADYSEVQKRARALLEESDYDKGPGLYPDATAQDLLAKAIELQADLFKDVELPKARGLQDSRHEHAN